MLIRSNQKPLNVTGRAIPPEVLTDIANSAMGKGAIIPFADNGGGIFSAELTPTDVKGHPTQAVRLRVPRDPEANTRPEVTATLSLIERVTYIDVNNDAFDFQQSESVVTEQSITWGDGGKSLTAEMYLVVSEDGQQNVATVASWVRTSPDPQTPILELHERILRVELTQGGSTACRLEPIAADFTVGCF